MLGLNGQKLVYDDTVKQGAIEKVLSGEMSMAEARRFYGIKGKSQVSDWIKAHELLSKGRLFEKRRIKSLKVETKVLPLGMTKEEEKEFRKLKQDNAELRESERLWRMKAIVYSNVVDVAEEVLNLAPGSLKKKYGAKLSKEAKDNIAK